MSRLPERSRRDPVLLGCLAAVLLPFAVGVVRAVFVHWTPIGDWALLELRTRSVGGTHTPLVGPYSRFGWSHPGPLLFYAFAIPYRLLGTRPQGLLVATLLVNAAAAAAVVLLAWRRGRRALTVGTSIALLVLCHALGAVFMRDPWNPYVPALPFAALVFLAWAVVCGDVWMLPVAAFVASFIVQTHVGYAALVVVVLVVMLAWKVVELVWRAIHARHSGEPREPRDRRRTGAVVGITLVVTIVAWLPPLIDQIVNPGNISALLDFFGKPHPTPTNDTALRVVGKALEFPGTWVTGHEVVRTSDFTTAIPGFFVPLGLAALLVGLVVAVRRRDRDASSLTLLVLATLGAAVYSISNVAGPLAAYLVRWLLVLGMLTWVAAAWALWPWLRRVLPRAGIGRGARLALALVAGAALVVPAAANVVDAASARAPWYRAGLVERRLAIETVAHVQSGGRPVLLMSKDDEWWTWGLAPRLEAAGIPVAARPRDVLHFGRHRVSLERDARVAVVVVVGPHALTLGRPAGGRLLASYVGHPDTEPPLGATATALRSVHAAEKGLLSDTVAVYQVPL